MIELIDKLKSQNVLEKQEYHALIENHHDNVLAAYLAEQAGALRDAVFGHEVYLRGLLEITNYCKNNCFYCGIRRDNHHVQRYRMTAGQILTCCRAAYNLGLRTFVLQGGDDPFFSDEFLIEIIEAIKKNFPDCAITLSIGEKSKASYVKYYQAGAERFLLRHESADLAHYAKLHPADMSLAQRCECLFNLKEIGYQVGAGFMVGSPGQSPASLAEDLIFLHRLQPHMVGIGPFIPHSQTPFKNFPVGSTSLTLFLLGLVRLMLPGSLLPATTALGSLEAQKREQALDFGANVLMPNISRLEDRPKYEIYEGKAHLDEEAAEGVPRLMKRLNELGYDVKATRGDAKNWAKKSRN